MKYLYIYILLIFVILFFAYYNSVQSISKENFTPHIRRLYRPYIRQARLFTESFHNHINGHINRLIRKTGLFK